MSRPTWRRWGWRWGVTATLAVVLGALPALAGVLPASAPAPPDLLSRVQHSQGVAWSGLAESTGALALPDVSELGGLPDLLGATTRSRVWWRGPTAYRADTVTTVGEQDLTVDPAGSWTWDSTDRRATRLQGEPAVRLPRPADLVPPLLGRRLARTPGLLASALPGRRVAGRTTSGLHLVPPAGSPTTVASVDVWADPGTGLPLRVEVRARGVRQPVLVSELLDLSLATPPLVRVAFGPPPDAEVREVAAPDLAARIDSAGAFQLPEVLAGQPRQGDRAGGVATYGVGLGSFSLLPLDQDLGHTLLQRIDPSDTDGRATVATPLLDVLVVRDSARPRVRHYLLLGTVPPAVLDAAAAQLLVERPRRRER